jgi:hypothetical protein
MLYIKAGPGVTNLYIDTLSFNKGGIIIEGEGVVNLYTNNISGLGNLNEGGNYEQLNVFYMGNDKVKLTNHKEVLNGSLYIKNADFEMTGGVINGGYILSPYATVDLSGGASIQGTIVAKAFDASGNGTLISSNADQSPIPDSDNNIDLSDLIISQPITEQ